MIARKYRWTDSNEVVPESRKIAVAKSAAKWNELENAIAGAVLYDYAVSVLEREQEYLHLEILRLGARLDTDQEHRGYAQVPVDN